MYRIVSIASSCLRYKIYTYVLCLKQSSFFASQPSLIVNWLPFLPWCTAITGYWISSNNSNSQQHPTINHRLTSKLLSGVSWPHKSETTTTENTYDNSSMLMLCLLFNAWALVLYVSILLASTSACRQKKHHVKCHMKFAAFYQNFTSTISCIIDQ